MCRGPSAHPQGHRRLHARDQAQPRQVPERAAEQRQRGRGHELVEAVSQLDIQERRHSVSHPGQQQQPAGAERAADVEHAAGPLWQRQPADLRAEAV